LSTAARSGDATYAHRPLTGKLGIKAGMRVGVFGAPAGFVDSLTEVPPKVSFTARAAPDCDLYICFVASRSELAARLATLPALIRDKPAWLAWPKKASGAVTNLDGNVVRESGLAAGLVDYKVCAIDATWSGLAFKRKRG
jgi:hypothetical protein